MRSTLFTILFFVITLAGFAQKGKIDGKITDEKTGNPIPGVSVIIKQSGKGVPTDVDGRFVLNAEAGTKYTLLISSTNYESKEITEVETGADGIAHLGISLNPKAKTSEEIVVKSTSAKRESVNALISFQKNTNTVASVISAEAIRRSPDRNTGEVLKRTPGASLIDGKFLVVRGLADRYNQAMLNGILLTSTEPDRKTFSFDIIPAQMIDNIVINKAFVPELPGEWAGGLIQVNTKDIPSKNFFNIQVGTGFNTQTIGKDFYKANGGSTDWLGIDDGTRGLGRGGYTNKSSFTLATQSEKNQVAKGLNNDWSAKPGTVSPNVSFQANGGFSGKVFGKKIGGIIGVNYSKSNKYTNITNRYQSVVNGNFSKDYDYEDDKYTQETTLGGLASLSFQLNSYNKISAKAIVNVNTNNYNIQRKGVTLITQDDVYGGELDFGQNTFLTTQLSGEHKIAAFKLKWYGAFNILDGYSPDQRRYQYTRPTGTQNPFQFLVGNSLAQESGSRIFQTLSDYIYTGGGDVSYDYKLFDQKQTVKGGYLLQVKDRLFDAQLFANYFNSGFNNAALRQLPIDKIFAPENFGNGADNLFSFNSINNRKNRYLANTILNAGYLQFDNQFTNNFRVVWGLRVEDFDQLLGTVKQWDTERFRHTKQTDYLPGINATYKVNNKTNLRFSGSQTVIRPEQRELASFTLFDFELNSSVEGNPELVRNKVTNFDLRYEVYPRSGEVLTVGAFYKHFDKPIEQVLRQGGQLFTFQNSDKAKAYGIEVEFRKKLDMVSGLKNFTIQTNAAYIYSKVTDEKQSVNRPLQGQSPYIFNVGLLYDLEKAGLNATLLFNQIGQRIYLVGKTDPGSTSGVPDIWEAPRPVLDFQVGKKLLKDKAEIRLGIADILNSTQYFYQNADTKTSFQKNKDAYRFTRKYGSTVSVTFNYSL